MTERLAPVLPVPASGLRQTGEGTVMIGVTQEDAGYDLSTTSAAAVRMTRKALRILPELGESAPGASMVVPASDDAGWVPRLCQPPRCTQARRSQLATLG